MIVLKILAALFLLMVFLFICLVGLGLAMDLIKKITQKRGQDVIVGDFSYWGTVAETKIRLEKNLEVPLNFPLVDGEISLPVRETIRKLKNYPNEMKISIEKAAIREFEEIKDSYKDTEEWPTIRNMEKLRDTEGAFLNEFEIVRIEINEDPEFVTIEYLSPWDPEHTRLAKLDFDLMVTGYTLTCADEAL